MVLMSLNSRYTMTKSSAVLFILFFSLIFKLEEPVSSPLLQTFVCWANKYQTEPVSSFVSLFLLFKPLSMQNPFLILVVLLISGGLFMFTFKSTQFNLEGFIMVLLAAFIGGIRWTLTQVLMQKAELGRLKRMNKLQYVEQSCTSWFACWHFSCKNT